MCDKIDVFLPGKDGVLTQSPKFCWKHDPKIIGHFYYSTRDPDDVMILIKGATEEQRAHLAKANVTIDHTSLKHHDLDGFGVALPGLLVTRQGTVIAVGQQRHASMSDGGHGNDVLISRSKDDGKSWSRQEVVPTEDGVYTQYGPVFEDRASSTIFLCYWKIPTDVLDDLGFFSTYAEQGGGFWLLKSRDEGRSWSKPFYVRPKRNSEGWIGWNNNSVHGIQLAWGKYKDRLVLPAFLYKKGEAGQVPGVRGGLVYSDDHGESWTTGAVLPEGSDEVTLVETVDGGIYVSYRKNTLSTGRRHFACSVDGGGSFCEYGEHEEITDRNLHAGLARYSSEVEGKPNIILFSNPRGPDMTIYMSRDEGRTWTTQKILASCPTRYSDLAVTPEGTILCLYTNGTVRDQEKITVARFNLEWLMDAGE